MGENLALSPREDIEKNGYHITKVTGVSMLPLLRQGKDTVFIAKGEPKKGEVALYESEDGRVCVLHRVIKVKGDIYIFRGDNCVGKEFVPKAQILGVLERIWRNGKEIEVKRSLGYKCYSLFWRLTAFIRIPIKKVKNKVKRIFNKKKSV
ncbi:MAG: S24/S26 family peptidase [Candidatus Coproplasma sp.]